MSRNESEIVEATEQIVKEASEEATLKRLKQKRYIRVNVNDDVSKKRFKPPIGSGDSSTQQIEDCYEDEINMAERRFVAAEKSVKEAKQAKSLFEGLSNGTTRPQGNLLSLVF